MTSALDQLLLPHLWRRYSAVARIVLGVGCFGLLQASFREKPFFLVGALCGLFLYALIIAFNSRMHDVAGGRLVLALDTLYFFAAVSLQTQTTFWFGACFGSVLLLSAALLNTWIDVLAVTAVSGVYLFLTHPMYDHGLLEAILLVGPFAAIVALQRQGLMDKLSHFSQQVLILRTEAEEARDSEKKRIAADFHDGPLQSFISFQMRLEIIRKLMAKNTEAGVNELIKLQDLCREQVTELRTFVRSMRPLEGGSANLAASILRMVKAFQHESGIQVSFAGAEGAGLEDLEANPEVLQVLREALYNTQKHSSASRVLINAARVNGFLDFSVRDDGKGFPFSGAFTLQELNAVRMGPEAIKRRVEDLKGDLLLESSPGKGSRLEIRLPI